MNRKFVFPKFRNNIGGSCPVGSEKILSTKAVQTASRCFGKTFAPFGSSLGGRVDRDAVRPLVEEAPNEFAGDRSQRCLVHLLSCFKHPFFAFLALATIHDASSPADLKPDRHRHNGVSALVSAYARRRRSSESLPAFQFRSRSRDESPSREFALRVACTQRHRPPS